MYFYVSIIFAVCACAAVAADEPRLTPAGVRQMADAEARQQGYDLEVYTRGEPSYAGFATDGHGGSSGVTFGFDKDGTMIFPDSFDR